MMMMMMMMMMEIKQECNTLRIKRKLHKTLSWTFIRPNKRSDPYLEPRLLSYFALIVLSELEVWEKLY